MTTKRIILAGGSGFLGRSLAGVLGDNGYEEFMRELRRAFGRPWAPPTPAPLERLGCWLMRTEPVLALTGRRGVPARLLRQGFEFNHPSLPEALKNVLA